MRKVFDMGRWLLSDVRDPTLWDSPVEPFGLGPVVRRDPINVDLADRLDRLEERLRVVSDALDSLLVLARNAGWRDTGSPARPRRRTARGCNLRRREPFGHRALFRSVSALNTWPE